MSKNKTANYYRATHDNQFLKLDVAIANKIGALEALFCRLIFDYCLHNERTSNQYYFHKEHYWTTLSYKKISESFAFFGNKNKLSRLTSSLEKKGYLFSDNFNANKSNKTKWYRVNEEKINEIIHSEIEKPTIPPTLSLQEEITPPPELPNLYAETPISNMGIPVPNMGMPVSNMGNLLITDQLDQTNTNKQTSNACAREEKNNAVETKEKNKSLNASCETKKKLQQKQSSETELTSVCLQSEQKDFRADKNTRATKTTNKNTRLDHKSPTEQQKTTSPKNSACSMVENKASHKRRGDINEYSRLKGQNSRLSVNRIDIETRKHLQRDLKALLASKISLQDKIYLSLLNDDFKGHFVRLHPSVQNIQAWFLSEKTVDFEIFVEGYLKEQEDKRVKLEAEKAKKEARDKAEKERLAKEKAIENAPEKEKIEQAIELHREQAKKTKARINTKLPIAIQSMLEVEYQQHLEKVELLQKRLEELM